MPVDIEAVKKAKAQVVEGSLTIWNARLEAMMGAGDLAGAVSHLHSPIERAGDQCDCGCGAGRVLREALTNPGL